MAEGVRGQMAGERRVIAVEPDQAPCVAVALKAGCVKRVPGDLRPSAEMLSCGKASAPALKILLRHDVKAIAVSEAELADAVATLSYHGGPVTIPSSAAGLAGLVVTRPSPPLELGIDENSRVFLIPSRADRGDAHYPALHGQMDGVAPVEMLKGRPSLSSGNRPLVLH